MDLNDILFGADRDKVTRASFSTYNLTELQRLGLQITVNTSSQKTQWVGSATNQIYPQIVVWRPNSPGSSTGRAVIVECIETRGTLSSNFDIGKWRTLAAIEGLTFNLVIPQENLQNVRDLLGQNNISTGVRLQTYTYNAVEDRYYFTTV